MSWLQTEKNKEVVLYFEKTYNTLFLSITINDFH